MRRYTYLYLNYIRYYGILKRRFFDETADVDTMLELLDIEKQINRIEYLENNRENLYRVLYRSKNQCDVDQFIKFINGDLSLSDMMKFLNETRH